MQASRTREFVQTLVIGGGQAGLSVGYHLARRGIPFVILDAHARIGDAWRRRWDSLRLFTPARYNGLPGMRFPRSGGTFVSKDEMADYLEAYAAHFRLPVRTGTRVERLATSGDRFVAVAGETTIEAENVVVAMATAQEARTPAFAGELDPRILQMHSAEYKNPAQLRDGTVLLVGVGNSGADIGMELARTHRTIIAGKEPGHVPFRIETPIARFVLIRMVRFVGHHVLTVRTPIGRRLRPKLLARGAPLVRVKPQDLVAAGIERVPRIVGVQEGRPLTADGRVLDVDNVLWCTGYHAGLSWIDLPIFDADGQPRHEGGIVPSQPGLYFVGLHFLYSATSETITGSQRDAKRIVNALAARSRESAAAIGHEVRPVAARAS